MGWSSFLSRAQVFQENHPEVEQQHAQLMRQLLRGFGMNGLWDNARSLIEQVWSPRVWPTCFRAIQPGVVWSNIPGISSPLCESHRSQVCAEKDLTDDELWAEVIKVK